ncbi:MAG: DUF4097 domain-containing protein [Candidatus Bathyarchaeota archaeon]|nr:DUF4097 domain-containing protein [Candidatus Bathyarchaeota archaeon]
MRNSAQLGLGGFLVGLGLGWLLSQTFIISYNVFAWLVIIAGAGVIVSALISWIRPRLSIGGLVGGLLIGLVLSILATSGMGFEERYRAEEIRTFDGAVAENAVSFVVANRNGAVRVSTWDRSEYTVELTIRARGLTDIEAQGIIDGLDIDLAEERVQNRLRLVLEYNIPTETWRRLSIEVAANLPAEANIDLDLQSSNGGIYLSDVTGDTIKLQTSNGQLDLDRVYSKSISAITSNGRIDGEIEAESASLTSSNGEIELTIPGTISGNYGLDTSNGNIHLAVSPSDQVGYDLGLSTSNGDIDINLSDLEYTKNERTSKEARTTGFSSRAKQITIEAETSNGNITLDTS